MYFNFEIFVVATEHTIFGIMLHTKTVKNLILVAMKYFKLTLK